MLKLFDYSNQLKNNHYLTATGIIIVASYIVYRLTRTLSALIWSIFLYRILPLIYQPNLTKFKNRWTVITGATDGIGRAYTIELAKRGLYKFFLIGRNAEKLNCVKRELESINCNCKIETFLFDFYDGNFAQLRNALADINVGLAVNSVGVGRKLLERYGDNPAADKQLLCVNGLGAAEFLSAILPPMERHGGGQIVALSSSQGIRPIAMLAAYSATKSLISFLCEAIDREYSTISVQCLTPALVATKMTCYKNGSLFVVTAEQFAREAVSLLGVVHRTSGCLNHELQLLLRHLFPWTVLKYLMMPIYWRQQQRMLYLQSQAKMQESTSTKFSFATQSVEQTNQIVGTPIAQKRIVGTKIPTTSSNTSNTIRHRA